MWRTAIMSPLLGRRGAGDRDGHVPTFTGAGPALRVSAMQFNFVVSTNTQAVQVWQRCGFAIVGRLPGVFLHPRDGFVDALIMYQTLTPSEGYF